MLIRQLQPALTHLHILLGGLLFLNSHSILTTLIHVPVKVQIENHISKLLFSLWHLPAQNLFQDPNDTQLQE